MVPLFLMVGLDLVLLLLVVVGFEISRRGRARPRRYVAVGRFDGADEPVCFLSPQASSVPLTGETSGADSVSLTPVALRRASGKVDHYGYDGYVDDDEVSSYDDFQDSLQDSSDMERFVRSMSKAVETSSIGLSFDFENLSFTTKKGKKILQGITATMPRGSCWGIMGGSGAGKSTFVNVLMGKAQATEGSIKINGWPKDMSKYKRLIGYVPQDDIVFPELTVRENILHSARVRLPAKWKDGEIQDHVDALLACLQLTHVQHSRVGDAAQPVISGGERKRCNIGIELAAAPMAIFLDEPSSGLDSSSAASIMRLLKVISRLGVTTIAIIHQPREQIFYGFDQLLLLSGGQSMYAGPTQDVQEYFEELGYVFPERSNVADTLMDIMTGDGAQYKATGAHKGSDTASLIEIWNGVGQYQLQSKNLLARLHGKWLHGDRRASNQSMHSTFEQEENLGRTMKARGATWLTQVYYCWRRAMVQQVRSATSFFFEISVGGIAGVVIGLSAFASNGHLFQGIYHPPFTILSSAVDYSSTPQIGLLGGMAIGLAASAPGAWTFGEEKLMYWREAASGHSRSAYYVGKLLSTLSRIALSSLHFTVFLGILATPLMSFWKMYAANLMYFWCIYGLGSVVSMFVKREDAPLLAVLASLVMGVLGGVAPPLSKVKVWKMEMYWRLSPGVWFTEAYFSENVMPLGYLYRIDVAAKSMGFTLGQYGRDVG
jgi:ABC-type multidrug transport system ATPase subunit